MRLLRLLLLSFMPMFLYAQNYIETGYTPSRSFLDKDRNKCGSGDLWQVKGRYSHTFSAKVNENGQPTVWAGTVNGTYAKMDNYGFASEYNPEQILNLGVNLSYIRPLSKENSKWYMMASIGAGIYAAPNDIAWRSVLANGGAVFVYRVRDNLDIGIGAGLTTSFGAPLVMPMAFVKWKSTGQYEINIEAMNNIKISVARQFGDKFKLAAVCDMDGMSSVFREEGKNKLYSMTRMQAFLNPELQIAKRTSLYMNIGADLYHSVKVTDKSVKGFADSFKSGDRWHFKQSFNVAVGFKYGIGQKSKK